ncbi:MAG: outer membrane beta-barrel protein [Ferruginibacter sp.]
MNQFINSGIENDTIQQFTDQLNTGNNYSANIAYTEPLGKKSQLQFNYSPSFSKNKSNQEVFQFDNASSKYSKLDSSLSNVFDNTLHNENFGINYRKGDKDNMFSAGLTYKYSILKSDQVFPANTNVNQTFNNILPFAMWRKKFNARENIRLMFRGSANPPSVNQLQNVVNNSNPLFLTAGNPDLKQQISRSFSARYNYTNTGKGKSFFANIYALQASDYIGNATFIAAGDSLIGNNVLLPRGAQLSKPINLDGYLSLRSFVTYGVPVKAIKSNLNLNGGFTWSKIPGYVNSLESLTDNFTYSSGVVVSSNINEYIDFTVSYSANFNVVKNNIQPLLNNNYVNQAAGVSLNLLSKKGWFLLNDVSTQMYSGLSEGFNQSYTLWNAGIGKKFLKKQAGELKLSVFDLLKQNKSITRNVNDSYVEDVQNQVLTQYFMLTFTYKLKNFGKVPAKPEGNSNMRGRQN